MENMKAQAVLNRKHLLSDKLLMHCKVGIAKQRALHMIIFHSSVQVASLQVASKLTIYSESVYYCRSRIQAVDGSNGKGAKLVRCVYENDG